MSDTNTRPDPAPDPAPDPEGETFDESGATESETPADAQERADTMRDQS